MTDIYDIKWNLVWNPIDINLTLYYFLWLFLVFVFYKIFFSKKKIDTKKQIIVDNIDYSKEIKTKFLKLKTQFENLEIQKFYDDINEIIKLFIFYKTWVKINDLSNKNIKNLNLDQTIKSDLLKVYLKQFESTFDSKEFRYVLIIELEKILF